MSAERLEKIRAVLLAALALLSMAGVASGQMFTGSWTADLTLSTVGPNPITSFESRLDCVADLGPFSLYTRSDFDMGGWLWQSFGLLTNVGFFSIQTDVLYAPDPWSFCYATSSVSFDFEIVWLVYHIGFLGSIFDSDILRGSVVEFGSSFAGVNARALFFLGATLDGVLFAPAPSYVPCSGDACCVAPADWERYYIVLPVQTSSLSFTGARVTLQSHLCYDVDVCSTTEFSPDGFEYQEFRTEIWSIGPVPVNLDVLLRFEVQSKSLALEPKLGLGNRACYGQLLIELLTPGPIGLIEGFSLYGLDLFFEAPGFAFRSLSLFDTGNFSLYYADGLDLSDVIWIDEIGSPGVCGSAGESLPDYWEIIGIAAYRGDPCCRVLSFVALSFFGDSDALFDWMRSEFRVELALMQDLRLRSTVALDSAGISEWKLGMAIAW